MIKLNVRIFNRDNYLSLPETDAKIELINDIGELLEDQADILESILEEFSTITIKPLQTMYITQWQCTKTQR